MKYTLQYHPDDGWSDTYLREAERRGIADLAGRGVVVDEVKRFSSTWVSRGQVYLVQDCTPVVLPPQKLEFRWAPIYWASFPVV